MQITVHLRDQQGVAHERELEVALPRFLKSAAVVGRGRVGFTRTFLHAAGVLLLHSEYFDLCWPFRFIRPQGWDYDPTTMGDFSTLAGRAIADICARQFSGAIATHGHEAAMLAQRIPLIGRRPDLYCDTGLKQFAVESKGSGDDSVSDAAMDQHTSSFHQRCNRQPRAAHRPARVAIRRVPVSRVGDLRRQECVAVWRSLPGPNHRRRERFRPSEDRCRTCGRSSTGRIRRVSRHKLIADTALTPHASKNRNGSLRRGHNVFPPVICAGRKPTEDRQSRGSRTGPQVNYAA